MRILPMTALALVLAGAGGAGPAAPPPATPKFAFPVACTIGRTCEIQNYVDDTPGPGVSDYRCGRQTYDGHDGVDIRLLDMAAQRRGVDVLAAAPGKVLRVRDGVADVSFRTVGKAAVEAQGCGNAVVVDHGGGWITGYCHLARGSLKVKVGDQVRTGQPVARVGLSGLTDAPHLHFSVVRNGVRIDPFAPAPPAAGGACKLQPSLWTDAAAKAMTYKRGVVLVAGLAGQAVDSDKLDEGGIPPPSPDAPYVVAYVRVLNLEKGDVSELVIKGPDGAVLTSNRLPALENHRAREFMMIGKKRPPGGWPRGVYTGAYKVYRSGAVALSKTFTVRF